MLNSEVEEVVQEIKESDVSNILDAIMLTSGNENINIRTTAFSILSSMSKYSSSCKTIKAQIERDIILPGNLTSKHYHDFMTSRLDKVR